jgi:hypothetical protein
MALETATYKNRINIGITGHQHLSDPNWVNEEIHLILSSQTFPIVGITSLAIGADQIFAQAVLDYHGTLQVIIPHERYAEAFRDSSIEEYERLLSSASVIETLTLNGSLEEAYFAAGKRVVDLAELLIAVWNGKPAAGLGGTGDVVAYANIREKPYIHINPVTRIVDTSTNTLRW